MKQFNAVVSLCVSSVKSSPPDASESSDSLQLEGTVQDPLKYLTDQSSVNI